MRINELFYWLQGYFEISGTTAPLTEDQASMMLRHFDLVDLTKLVPSDAARLNKMRVLLDFGLDGSMSLAAVTLKLRTEISEQFVHVIDPAAGPLATQISLNKAHGNSGVAMRC